MKLSDTSKLIEVKLATEKDLEKVYGILSQCAAKLKERELNDWTSYYTKERVESKLKDGVMYLVLIDSNEVACFGLAKQVIYYYTETDNKQFTAPEEKAWYLSALAVDPQIQGQGIGSKILKYVEQKALDAGIKHIRLDCNATDPVLRKFYQGNNYVKVAVMDGEPDYWLMEKNL